MATSTRVRGRRHAPIDPDHVVWPLRLTFEGNGAVIGVRVSDATLQPAVRRIVPPGARVGNAIVADAKFSILVKHRGARRVFAPMHRLYEGTRCLFETRDLDALLARLESDVHFAMACHARTKLFVHAGVVGWKGGAVLLPGRTHAGKTSLVAALMRAGATYYSDEYAVLDDAGLVHPFARSLGVRDAAGRIRVLSPGTLGPVADRAAPIALIVATRHVAGARWRPTPMSPGETVLSLLDNTLAAQSRPGDVLRILSKAVVGARALRGPRGDAGRVAVRLLAECPPQPHLELLRR